MTLLGDPNVWADFIIGNGLTAFFILIGIILMISLVIAFFISWFIDCSVEERWQSPIRYAKNSMEWMWRKQ